MSVTSKYLHLFAIILFYSTILAAAQNEITCKDENGKSVDWFYLYKLPGRYGVPNVSKGRMFLYFTSNSGDTTWRLSNRTIGDLDSITGHTITQAFVDNSTERLVFAYNDEPPGLKPNGYKGHTKGLVVADSKSGFWLIHSVPKFPLITENPRQYFYPITGTLYGQSFLCISLNVSQINVVGKQLFYNEPQFYTTKISDQLRMLYPNFVSLLQQHKPTVPPFWNEETLFSLNNVEFKSFAKSGRFRRDLYEDWVAPVLNTDLYVETWRHGPGNLPSNCTHKTRVWNVSKVKILDIYQFETLNDHSKWGVSDTNSDWICVGDINRAERQKMRGGGTVCQYSKGISQSYRMLVNGFEPCPAGNYVNEPSQQRKWWWWFWGK